MTNIPNCFKTKSKEKECCNLNNKPRRLIIHSFDREQLNPQIQIKLATY